MTGFAPVLAFVYRGPKCPGFRATRFNEFIQDIREARPTNKRGWGDEVARKVLGIPMEENFEKKSILSQDLAEELDMSLLISELCGVYAKNGYELNKTFNLCIFTRNEKKQILPIRWGYENYKAVFEVAFIYHIVALYDYSRLVDVEPICRSPQNYYYVDPISYPAPKYHVGGVRLEPARSEAVLAYHSGYDKLEQGTPDGLFIEVGLEQYPKLRVSDKGEVSKGFFDFWPEIPALSQPTEPIEGNTTHNATYVNKELVLKNPDKGKKHIEFCKAYRYPEAYYKFGLSFKNSITGKELVFPETFIRLRVFDQNA